MASVCGCVTAEKDRVRAAPATTAEPGLADASQEEPSEPGALDAAVASMQAPADTRAESADRWTFSVTPFLWAPGVTITTTENGISQLSEASPGHLLFDLNGAAMLHAEARRGRFFAFGEFVWFEL